MNKMLGKWVVLSMAFLLVAQLGACQSLETENTGQITEEATTNIQNEDSIVVESKEEEISSVTEETLNDEAKNEILLEEESVCEEELKAEQKGQEEDNKSKELDYEITVFENPKDMYAVSAVNVRKGPSTDYEIVSYLKANQKIRVYAVADTGWFQLKIGGEEAYTSHHYLSEKLEIQNQETVEEKSMGQVQNQTKEEVKEASKASTAPAGVIMVGDSRCVQMQEAVGGGGCSWVCENSKEYTWFTEKAIPKIDASVGNGTKIVINMGVNDPEHYKDYVATVNAKAAEWAQKGATTYFVSVNPVWENPYVTQEQVETFNANVPGLLAGVRWIDTCSWLNANGCKIVDGVHYDHDTYVNIFNLIMGSI